jgi:hypothetical protein
MIAQRKQLKLIVELLIQLKAIFSAKFVGVMNKVHQIHFSILANVMVLSGLFIMSA